MGVFSKRTDPISQRTRELNSKIQALEAQIKQLSERNGRARPEPKVRSTARPSGANGSGPAARLPHEPIFESVDHHRPAPCETHAAHYNDLGVRKYDLVGAFKRLANHIQGPGTNNPKLVNYLAAGSIKGLRPLRYERRVARNRVIVLTIFFLFVLWGMFALMFSR